MSNNDAEARFAVAQRGLVLLAPNRDAGELRQARDEIELFGVRAARRVEVQRKRAVDAVARGDDRRRAAGADAVREQRRWRAPPRADRLRRRERRLAGRATPPTPHEPERKPTGNLASSSVTAPASNPLGGRQAQLTAHRRRAA